MAGLRVFDEDHAHAVLILFAAEIKVDHGAAKRENARAILISSGFDYHTHFRLQPRTAVQAEISSLQTQVAHRGLLFECCTILGLAGDGRVEANASPLSEA